LDRIVLGCIDNVGGSELSGDIERADSAQSGSGRLLGVFGQAVVQRFAQVREFTLQPCDPARLSIADPFGDGNTSRRGAGAPLRAVNLSRMVDRNDAAVTAVYIGGRYLFGGGTADPVLGTARTGRFLRAGSALTRRARECRRPR
jgi:hypothetical protein